MRVPDVADRLRLLSSETGNDELAALADHLRRRRPVRRADPVSAKMTPELVAKIQDYAKANPSQPYSVIATMHGVNIGRVSEALAGFRR
ncbi:hypothetical protein [Methylobacterium sp. yr596]|uniref:hypothetical protein n=1 Tax=Methylobacterium sp. yr596 TaxID=1761800 RepID=UPI0008EC1920|nr:hypothetical protein [Methylobacterium sp. yr596]SFF77087.1 hypothetical protein SAMN04487844_14731 [Methylobacterium sp. yr596]